MNNASQIIFVGIANHYMNIDHISKIKEMQQYGGLSKEMQELGLNNPEDFDMDLIQTHIKKYINIIIESRTNRVFVEDNSADFTRSPQFPLYKSLEPFVKEFIPVGPNLPISFNNKSLALYEYCYALNVADVLNDRPGVYGFLIGGSHLSSFAEKESPVEFALKKMGLNVWCIYLNFFKKFDKNHEESLEDRKNLIARLVDLAPFE